MDKSFRDALKKELLFTAVSLACFVVIFSIYSIYRATLYTSFGSPSNDSAEVIILNMVLLYFGFYALGLTINYNSKPYAAAAMIRMAILFAIYYCMFINYNVRLSYIVYEDFFPGENLLSRINAKNDLLTMSNTEIIVTSLAAFFAYATILIRNYKDK
jgi:hypothetical protein